MAVFYLRPTVVTDPYSGVPDSEDWGAPERIDVPAAFVITSDTSTSTDGTNEADAQSWTLYIPAGAPSPGPRDRVEFDGVVFAQDGIPVREVNPFTGWAPYARVRLRAARRAG